MLVKLNVEMSQKGLLLSFFFGVNKKQKKTNTHLSLWNEKVKNVTV